jgi:hypothetical protein
MVQGIPYVHWKIKDAVDLTEIDPVYLWGTVIESDKGPTNTPVFCTNAEQAKRIFNYDLNPFFVNGGRSVVIVRAYAGEPKQASFKFELSEPFKYVYADYDYYDKTDNTTVKAKVYVDDPNAVKPKAIKGVKIYAFTSYSDSSKTTQYGTGTVKTTGVVNGNYAEVTIVENSADNDDFAPGKKFFVSKDAVVDGETTTQLFTAASDDAGVGVYVTIEELSGELNVVFSEGRWRVCDDKGNIQYFYEEEGTIKNAVFSKDFGRYYPEGTDPASITIDTVALPADVDVFMKSFNESDIKKITVARVEEIAENAPVIELKTIYPGDFLIPVSVQKDIRAGYRVSIKESDDYTILLSSATTLEAISKRINERATNITATITRAGQKVEKPFTSTLISVKNTDGTYKLPSLEEDGALDQYTQYVQDYGIPVGSIFAKVPKDNNDTDDFEFKLIETVTYLADGSNGMWNGELHRIADPSILQNRQLIAAAHKEALDHLANIKVAGIFCNYGEDEVQKVYADHVSTTEPEGMNSAEVCKWRTLIVGANADDRTNDIGDTSGFKLIDKAVAFDNENILFLGQGLIDDGYTPESNLMKNPDVFSEDEYVALISEDAGALPNQLLPFQCTQYVAGLRSKLFYGDAIFGGEAKKEIVGVGNLSIAPLFAGENKLLWQPDNYAELNQHGVLTFTTDYNYLTLTDGVTTRQSPLEEDEEGVQSIIKYAKHAVHEELQTFIGRNLTDDLQIIMENSVKGILSLMQTQDQTLTSVASEDLAAYDVSIVLVPKTNAQQLLAKAYVYLTLTPVHALRQIEVELTVQ